MAAICLMLIRWACLLTLIATLCAANTVTLTKTVTKTRTKHYATTVTSTTLGSNATIIYGSDGGYAYPTDVSTTTLTSVPTIYVTFTQTFQTRTTVAGTATNTVTVAALWGNPVLPIQDTLPSAAYFFHEGGADPVVKRTVVEDAHPGEPALAPRADDCKKTSTVTKSKVKTVKVTITKTTTATFTGSYITWTEESYGIPVSEYTSPKYTSTKTVTTTDSDTDDANYVYTTVTTTTPGTLTLLSTTTDVYKACETKNFADSIALSDGTHRPIEQLRGGTTGFEQNGPYSGFPTAYDCCHGSGPLDSAWLFIPADDKGDSQCSWFRDDNTEICVEFPFTAGSHLVAYYGEANSSTRGTYGNAPCGSILQAHPQISD